jgi:hypothetical protein
MAHNQPTRPQGAEQQPDWVIFEHTLMQAIADGVLHPMGWAKGKPLMATVGTISDLPGGEIQDLFEQFFTWQRNLEPTLPEEDRLFSTKASNGKFVWVIEDGQAITVLYPEEY